MLFVEFFRRSEVHRHAVLNHAITLENPVERRERTPAIDHVIFRNDLEPVDNRLVFENMLVVRNAEADSDPVVFESVESICRHGCWVKGRA